MDSDYDQARRLVLSSLTEAERASAIVYLRLEPIAAGGSLAIPGDPLTIKVLSWIAFVDPEPAANWGHACRYLVIEQAYGELTSIAARFPAFRSGDPLWEVLQRPA